MIWKFLLIMTFIGVLILIGNLAEKIGSSDGDKEDSDGNEEDS